MYFLPPSREGRRHKWMLLRVPRVGTARATMGIRVGQFEYLDTSDISSSAPEARSPPFRHLLRAICQSSAFITPVRWSLIVYSSLESIILVEWLTSCLCLLATGWSNIQWTRSILVYCWARIVTDVEAWHWQRKLLVINCGSDHKTIMWGFIPVKTSVQDYVLLLCKHTFFFPINRTLVMVHTFEKKVPANENGTLDWARLNHKRKGWLKLGRLGLPVVDWNLARRKCVLCGWVCVVHVSVLDKLVVWLCQVGRSPHPSVSDCIGGKWNELQVKGKK